MSKLFNVSTRQIQRWSCDPDYAESQRNPMDKYETVLRHLCEMGRREVGRGAVDRQAQIVGCTLVCSGGAHPDKETLYEELLDDLPSLAEFHKAITDRQDITVVRELRRKLREELDQSYEAYVREFE